MPMNRHLTWGDRQAEVSRDKNLKRLQKLAAMSPPPGTSAEEPSRPATKGKSTAKGAKPAAKPATQSATKKAAPAKAAAKKKNSSKK